MRLEIITIMQKINSSEYHLVYPHQLFEEVVHLPKTTHLLLIEDPLYFNDKKYPRKFHKQKLILHRAAMKSFADRLSQQGFDVHYLEYTQYPNPEYVFTFLKKRQATAVSVFEPTDDILERRLQKASQAHALPLTTLETPNFLTSISTCKQFFGTKKRWLMQSFYIFQRKRLSILVTADGQPAGGKWSFDTENRKRLPKNTILPQPLQFPKNEYVPEAIEYINRHFPDNPGETGIFNYPIDHQQARQLLTHFLQQKLNQFGAYEDAIAAQESVLFHSQLSAPLNCGLLSPQEIIDQTLKLVDQAPLASLEGFVRQIIGWREFMRAVYVLRGSTMRTSNALNHTKRLPTGWYDASTGVEPLDTTIGKVLKYSYCHHIERLMILGNFLLLAQVDPDKIYGWFMDMFIDAYDWVMVPNVYAMSQFADGGTITTKPYFSSSNYILKMSDYKKGDWCQVWNGLFYAFMAKHRQLLAANPRLSILLKNLDAVTAEQWASFQKATQKYV